MSYPRVARAVMVPKVTYRDGSVNAAQLTETHNAEVLGETREAVNRMASMLDASEAASALVMPDPARFAWMNQLGSTWEIAPTGSWFLTQPVTRPAITATNWSLLLTAAPKVPYSVVARFVLCQASKSYIGAGLCWRESSSQRLVLAHFRAGSLRVDQYYDTQTLEGNEFSQTWTNSASTWWRLRESESDRDLSVSPDGTNWIVLLSHQRNSFMTADQVGLCVNSHNLATPYLPACMSLERWEVR